MASFPDLPIYCITLDSTPERTAGAKEQFTAAGLSPQFIRGIDGRDWGLRSVLPWGEHLPGGRAGYTMPSAKIGLLLSHRTAWQMIAMGDAPAGIIFEDDAVLCPDFRGQFNQVLDVLPKDWQIVYLGYLVGAKLPRERVNDWLEVVKYPQCLHAYMIRKEMADRLLGKVNRAQMSADIAMASYVLPFVPHYECSPPLVKQRTIMGDWPTTMIDDDGYASFSAEPLAVDAGPAKAVRGGGLLVPRLQAAAGIYRQIEALFPKLHGWCGVEKACWLVNAIIQKQPHLVVEIGVFGGRGLLAMSLAMQQVNAERETKGRALGIDPYTAAAATEGEPDGEHKTWWSRIDYAKVLAGAERLVADRGGDCTDLAIATAQEHAAKFAAGSIDLLHIDGNHSELASMRDVETYLPLVKPNGLIVLDDIDWKSVEKARNLLRERCEVVFHGGSWEAYRVRASAPAN